ncbi:large ribosomal subunit protein eL8-like [Acipenser ruthenus]|uniref:large ribosomal subunit protein eL8-like n=1 Tax=Acipenser ruthenus TaxID=7906 RepID=UPI0027417E86|nr:large ribosomal subunit protein eL8-like [Acipenser ruthenus]
MVRDSAHRPTVAPAGQSPHELKWTPAGLAFVHQEPQNDCLEQRLWGDFKPSRAMQNRKRFTEAAANMCCAAAGKGDTPTERPPVLRAGVNTVTTLVESKKAQLVVIAHDVDPIELVVFLPALCCKMGFPYCFVKVKARLGHLLHRKTCTSFVFTQINPEDKRTLAKLVEAVKTNNNDRYDEIRRHWGGNVMGLKSTACVAKLEKAKAKEQAGLNLPSLCLPVLYIKIKISEKTAVVESSQALEACASA